MSTDERNPTARSEAATNPALPKKAEAAGLDQRQAQPQGTSNTTQGGHSIISSEGAIGRQFNPDGNIGQLGNKVGGPFSEDGFIGSQFDASKEGIAGKVERAVGGPRKEN
ncbi:hypothetical protein TWF694_002609 [Orbilia ellipsospora]|uniref:Uncharacterized protein n=1 Tax=Orbilia ellipsospora TaxID=2528407 RepID=A0AAV9X2Q8_9PEZI